MKERWVWCRNTNLVELIPKTSLGFKVVLISSIAFILLFSFWDFVSIHHELIRNLGLVCAALVGFPMLIWRTRIADRQAATGEASHTAETYTKAIEQLGAKSADGKPSMELRLGGLYALENIARTNEKYHPQIIEVLCAYVRMHASKPVNLPSDRELQEMIASGDLVLTEGEPSPSLDIQAALTIIGRRNVEFDGPERLNLTRTRLAGSQLAKANFAGADFSEADLTRINFAGTDLTEAYLTKANLADAYLADANLTSAVLIQAIITRADLSRVRLSSAYLSYADLSAARCFESNLTSASLFQSNLTNALLLRANLTEANLTEANLTEADLTEADLTEANFTRANIPLVRLHKTNIKGVYPPEKENKLLNIMQQQEGTRDQQESSNL